LENKRYFTSLDLKGAFHQIKMDEASKIFTSFHWNGELWWWNVMTYGFVSASQVFQQVMDFEIKLAQAEYGDKHGSYETFARAYVDDVLIASDDWETHLRHIDAILSRFKKVGLRVHPRKSLFAGETTHFLGFTIGAYGITPEEAKIKAIKDMPQPTNVSELRAQLGLCNYYRAFLPHMSERIALLRLKLSKGATFKWGEREQEELQALKDELCKPGLVLKHYDPQRPLILHTDWSVHGIGAILAQKDDEGKEYMVACCSRSLNEAESKYSSFHGELLAVVYACRQFHIYLHGNQFQIITDHSPLQWLTTTKEFKNNMHCRWAMALQDYDFKIVHRPGSLHQNADVTSRFPVGGDRDFTGARLQGAAQSSSPTTTLPPVAMLADAVQMVHISGKRLFGWGDAAEDTVQSGHPAFSLAVMTAHFTGSQVCASQYAEKLASRDTQNLGGGASDNEPIVSKTYEDTEHHALLSVGPDEQGSVGAVTQWQLTKEEQIPTRDQPAEPLGMSGEPSAIYEMTVEWVKRARQVLARPDRPRETHQRAWQPCCVDARTFGHGGLNVIEVFGGIGTGLETLLRSGVKIRSYVYIENDIEVRRVMKGRLSCLARRYPTLISEEVIEGAMDVMPHDVRDVRTQHIEVALPLSSKVGRYAMKKEPQTAP